MKLQEIARRIQADCIGDGLIEIDGVALPQAAGPREVAFLEGGAALTQAAALNAGAFLVSHKAALEDPRPRLVSPAPRVAFIRLLELFAPLTPLPQGIHPSVVMGQGCRIHPSARLMAGTVLGDRVEIGEKAVLHPLCFVGDDAKVGAESILHPQVSVGWGCQVGPRCILFSGVVLGADGFGHHLEDGRHYRFPHLGTVRLEEEVEVGANTTIDRAILGETLIGAGTKIDNLVQIAHNSRIGRRCYIVSQAGVGGSCRIGDNVTLAGQSGVSDHVRIGDGAIALGQSGIRSDVQEGGIVGGSPALPARLINQINQALPQVPRLVEQLDGNGRPAAALSQSGLQGWREEVLELLAAELRVPVGRLKPDTDLRQEFDADSLAVLTILSQIESRFEISIPDEAIRRLRTPGAILDYLEGGGVVS